MEPRLWTPATRAQHNGDHLRYSSDLADAERALVDTDDRLLTVVVGAASVQDRDGAGPLASASRNRFPFVERILADRGYQGERVRRTSPVPVEIVRPKPGQIGFAVQPRRWVVERTSAWLGRNRRLGKDAGDNDRLLDCLPSRRSRNVPLRRIASAE